MVRSKELKERIRIIERIWHSCFLCPRNCGVNRWAGELGYCGVGRHGRLFQEYINYGEELELIPSHTVYFTGCNLRCCYCQFEDFVARPELGITLTPYGLAEIIERGRAAGAKNVNFVGGEPMVSIYSILNALLYLKIEQKIVLDTNMYFHPLLFDLLDGVVDVYVADLKYGNDLCAQRLSGGENYCAVVTDNLRRVYGRTEVIVRHLLLPGHQECCFRPLAAWLSRNLPGVKFSLLYQYIPSVPAMIIPLS